MIIEKIWPVKKYYQKNINLNEVISKQQDEINIIKNSLSKIKAEYELLISENDACNIQIKNLLSEKKILLDQLNLQKDLITGLNEEMKSQNAKMTAINSKVYWEERYKSGGTSGAGSYNKLAEFKASVINKFVVENDIKTVIELGCGDGNQLTYMTYPHYVGVDVSSSIIQSNIIKFKNDPTKCFYMTEDRLKYINQNYDLAISLDVIFHLLEKDVYEQYMDDLFSLSTRFVIIYSSNYEAYTPWPEFRHRNFMSYIQDNKMDEWKLHSYIPNQYPYKIGHENDTSYSDFYIFTRENKR